MVELLIVTVDGDTAVVRYGPGHGGHACDDAGGRVVTQDGVRRLSVFTTPTQDKDFTVTYRHTATFLKDRRERTSQRRQLSPNKLILIYDALIFIFIPDKLYSGRNVETGVGGSIVIVGEHLVKYYTTHNPLGAAWFCLIPIHSIIKKKNLGK